MTDNLRSKVIRLAHQKPELREALLPLLTERSRLASREIPVEISEVVDEIRGYVKAAARGIGWKFNGGDFGYSGKSYSFNIEDDKSNKVDLILDFSSTLNLGYGLNPTSVLRQRRRTTL